MPLEASEHQGDLTLPPTESDSNVTLTSSASQPDVNYPSAALQTPGYVINDRFDYEQKYPPDKQFKEMSPTARIWKTYEDESGKYDLEMAADWRDGLDILLVFAALFSAVVSTFVAQTSQSLQVDYSEVAASRMSESIAVERAILAFLQGHYDEAAQPIPSSSVAFQPSTSDFWVNALWFTSLGLSLTTTLIAVLAKQWIHQYMSIPSGTPLDRSRIRHYRYTALQKWRVPFIIGFLPVLMHLALGLFFIGLIVYLRALSTVIAVDMAFITFAAYAMYFSCNLLPLYHPDCPYKTPLSSYGYAILCTIRRHGILRGLGANGSSTRSFPDSLKDLEHEAVEQEARDVEASAVTWLYNTTSNISVQSIVLQALSSLPLESIGVIATAADGIKRAMVAVNALYSPDQAAEQFGRFQRAAVRFYGYDTVENNVYSVDRIGTQAAIQILEGNLLGVPDDSWPESDVLLWGKVFETAMSQGAGWLVISPDTPSQVWCALLRGAVVHHVCKQLNCHGRDPELYTFWMPPDTDWPPLIVSTYDIETNGTAQTLRFALAQNMLPSFITWVLRVGFSSFTRSAEDHTHNLPDDIFLLLVMLQTPAIQRTGMSCYDTWCEDGSESLFRSILTIVEDYAVNCIPSKGHSDVQIDLATILALKKVVTSGSFQSNDIISPQDKEFILRILFLGLNRRLDLDGIDAHDFSWLNSINITDVIGAIFACETAPYMLRTLVNVFRYLQMSYPSTPNTVAGLEMIYSSLMDRHWLEGLASTTFSAVANNPEQSTSDNVCDPLHIWTLRFTSFLASLYIDGLTILEAEIPSRYTVVLENLCQSTNLLTLCKILLLADLGTQARLWKLAVIVKLPHEAWDPCLRNLCDFSRSPEAKKLYMSSAQWESEGIGETSPVYLSLQETPGVAESFKKDVERGHFIPPSYRGGTHRIHDAEVARNMWRSEERRKSYRETWIQKNAHNPTDPRQREYLERAEKWHALRNLAKTTGPVAVT